MEQGWAQQRRMPLASPTLGSSREGARPRSVERDSRFRLQLHGPRGEAFLDRHRVRELHFITHIENLPSIAEHGLLSNHRARRVPHESVALQHIQERRERTKVPGGHNLHDYANLYFNGRNAMLYRRVREDHEVLCVVRVDPAVLDAPGVVVTVENAAVGLPRFFEPLKGVATIEEDVVYAEWWKHQGDPVATDRHRAAMGAEILVPHVVPPHYLLGVRVPCSRVLAVVEGYGTTLSAVIDRPLFFSECAQ